MADADDLLRALTALRTAQERWLADCAQALPSDHAFAAIFRRWQEQLTMVKLQVHRADHRLLHYVAAGRGDPEHDPDESSATRVDGRAVACAWRERFEGYFLRVHLNTAYRRLDGVLDLDQEAVTADIVTDLSTLAEVATLTAPPLHRLMHERDAVALEDAAFYQVVSPWKRTGLPALTAVLRWLDETLGEMDDW